MDMVYIEWMFHMVFIVKVVDVSVVEACLESSVLYTWHARVW